MLWQNRRDPSRLTVWGGLFALGALSTALLFWQTRAGPAAQLLSIPGATALLWAAAAWLLGIRDAVVRIALLLALLVIVIAIASGRATAFLAKPPTPGRQAVSAANSACPTLRALAPVARQRPGIVLTFVDLGPRLITVTPHNAITGPYHRNSAQIIDVMHAWRGTADNARATIAHYRVDYVLICPNMSESTIYRSEAPQGFYVQLLRGKVPAWLAPLPLPPGSPYRMWRVVR
jgi:hypothetical protein